MCINAENHKTLIYQGELNRIAAWVEEYPNLETGGDLFGFWTNTGAPVLQFVLGPGSNSRHYPTSFYQDRDFLIQAGRILQNEHGLQHIGEWHSHHQMGIAKPSDGDRATVFRAVEKYNLQKFLICIANLEPSSECGTNEFRNKWKVNLGSFLFTNSRSNYQIGSWVVLLGDSPIRSALQHYRWKPEGDFLNEPLHQSDSWRGVIEETTLQFEESIIIEPIEISKDVWYSKPEGKVLLKRTYEELNNSFVNCQMLRNPLEQICFTFEEHRGKWRVELPDDYPDSPPSIRFNGNPIRVAPWTKVTNIVYLVVAQLEINEENGN